MKKICTYLLCLTFLACKTLPQGETVIPSPVNPEGDNYFFASLPQQRAFIDFMLKQQELQDPAVDNILDRTRWISASSKGQGLWALHLEGRYPLGKIRIGLSASSDWQESSFESENMSMGFSDEGEDDYFEYDSLSLTSYVHNKTGLRLILADRERLWVISPGMSFKLYEYKESGEDSVFHFRVGSEALNILNLQQASISPFLQGIDLKLEENGQNGVFLLNIGLKSLPGKERALTAVGKVFMLSLLGPRAMDARVERTREEVLFQNMEIQMDEWAELYRSILSGE